MNTPSTNETEPDVAALSARRERLLGGIVTKSGRALELLGQMPHEQSAIRGHFTNRCRTCLATTSITEVMHDAQQALAETNTPEQMQPETDG